jgi:hypothetical protein
MADNLTAPIYWNDTEYVTKYPSTTRKKLWRFIVRDYFMLFTESEYLKAVKSASDQDKITCITPIKKGGIRPTKRLNGNCVFDPPKQQGLF